jgi:hypothetical protein
MHAQLESGVPTANGYSGHFPKEDWPFMRPQGDKALRWITTAKPDRFHDLKPDEPNMRWCIASMTDEPIGKSVNIRTYNPLKARQHESTWIDSAESVLFEAEDIAIGKKFGMLYLKNSKGKYPNKWVLITRNSNGIPAKRGDYKITNIQLVTEKGDATALVTDENLPEKNAYIWSINARTGEFLGQRHRTLQGK